MQVDRTGGHIPFSICHVTYATIMSDYNITAGWDLQAVFEEDIHPLGIFTSMVIDSPTIKSGVDKLVHAMFYRPFPMQMRQNGLR